MVYNTCLGQKIFTIGLPAECAALFFCMSQTHTHNHRQSDFLSSWSELKIQLNQRWRNAQYLSQHFKSRANPPDLKWRLTAEVLGVSPSLIEHKVL